MAILALVSWPFCGVAVPSLSAQPFRFPTANHSLLRPDGGPEFFAPTPGRTWTAGQFGCVRSEGTQMHEGVDILAQKKDRRGEPLDEVTAAADGKVAYACRRSALSNYGNYLVLEHRIEGIPVYTLYAHLREIRPELAPGRPVRAGQVVGVLGRTTNTRTPITKDRAHLHFEIDLLVNEGFSAWLKKTEPDTRDDHGPWNGRNLLGLDPVAIFREQQEKGRRFSLLQHIRGRTEMCRVLVPRSSFPWLERYPSLVRRSPVAERQGIAAYEASLDYNGVPCRLVPRSKSEIQGPLSIRVLDVDEGEFRKHGCRQLVFKRGQSWELTARGRQLIELLID